MLSHAPACGKIPRRARASVQLAGESWTRFLEIYDALADPDGDQIIEQFGPFYARVRQLQRLGVPFDEGFIRRVEAIALSCHDTDSDPDQDGGDLRLADGDSCDEDEIGGTMACDQTIAAIGIEHYDENQRSKFDPPAGQNFHVVTGESLSQKPKAGANIGPWKPEYARTFDRMAMKDRR